ncbi:MAG: glycosyltransferase family protein [Vampirovibrionales bacterium]|nr:glycosyltransferase family protein [Vampirovibrionales bacterium]
MTFPETPVAPVALDASTPTYDDSAMTATAIIQARMTSTRLPGKVLMPVLGFPLLTVLHQRLKQSRLIKRVVLAITTNATDDPLAQWAEAHQVTCVRGNEQDVLSRYALAAQLCQTSAIVRITSDCPLIDATEVDRVIQAFFEQGADYASNTLLRSYPRGLDCEVFSLKALQFAQAHATRPEQREHVTPYFYQNPEQFKLINHLNPLGDQSHHRWTVDTPEDFELITRILTALWPQDTAFTQADVLALLEKNPGWLNLNAHVEQKKLAANT